MFNTCAATYRYNLVPRDYTFKGKTYHGCLEARCGASSSSGYGIDGHEIHPTRHYAIVTPRGSLVADLGYLRGADYSKTVKSSDEVKARMFEAGYTQPFRWAREGRLYWAGALRRSARRAGFAVCDNPYDLAAPLWAWLKVAGVAMGRTRKMWATLTEQARRYNAL